MKPTVLESTDGSQAVLLHFIPRAAALLKAVAFHKGRTPKLLAYDGVSAFVSCCRFGGASTSAELDRLDT